MDQQQVKVTIYRLQLEEKAAWSTADDVLISVPAPAAMKAVR